MTVRVAGCSYTCECNAVMMFLEGLDVPRRRMVCCTKGCPHEGVVVLEPLITVEPS